MLLTFFSLDSLRQLAKLNMSFNHLTQLPITLGNIPTLKGQLFFSLDSLRQLAKLNLSFNHLSQLPITLGNIPTLKGQLCCRQISCDS